MTDLRVPTVALDAEIVCAGGSWFVGRIFLPVASSHHSGPMRADEWMNDSTPFFPFLPQGASEPVILNKEEVVVLTLIARPGVEDEERLDSPVRHVQVECQDRALKGDVFIDMPEGHQRVLDYLNRPDPFLVMVDGDREHLVRKKAIVRVLETRGK